MFTVISYLLVYSTDSYKRACDRVIELNKQCKYKLVRYQLEEKVVSDEARGGKHGEKLVDLSRDQSLTYSVPLR